MTKQPWFRFTATTSLSNQLERKRKGKKPSHCLAQLCYQGRYWVWNQSLTLRACRTALQRCGLKMLLKKGRKKKNKEHLKRWFSHPELKACREWFKNPWKNCTLVKWKMDSIKLEKVMFEAAAAQAPMLTLAVAGCRNTALLCLSSAKDSLLKLTWILPLSTVSFSIRAPKSCICSTDFYNVEWTSIWWHN